MDATSTVEVVGAEGGAGGSGAGDMAASVNSIMENSKDAMAELFQDDAEVGNIQGQHLPLWCRREVAKMEEQTLLIQDMLNRLIISTFA